eukprot:TRINITY_DN9876_c0_g1_i2.p1 TRINITY_DN9876_c0_g1~~TRINITY_DN9876_c0_g1_i2.p1  ORF type:complete len:144 (+),score=19.19 TRINITY_DN9876_c0_g1_i2:319-750(+)
MSNFPHQLYEDDHSTLVEEARKFYAGVIVWPGTWEINGSVERVYQTGTFCGNIQLGKDGQVEARLPEYSISDNYGYRTIEMGYFKGSWFPNGKLNLGDHSGMIYGDSGYNLCHSVKFLWKVKSVDSISWGSCTQSGLKFVFED